MFRLRKLSALAYVSIALFILQSATLGYVISLANKDNTSTTLVYQNGPQGIPGPVGATGLQGLNGVGQIGAPGSNGVNGSDGKSGTILQQIQPIITPASQPIKGDPGLNGVDGQPGKDGEKLSLRKNPVNGNIEQRYESDDGWQTLITKCEYQGNCDVN